MAINRKQYDQIVREKSPSSPLGKDLLRAFLIGGAICALGQALLCLWGKAGLSQMEAASAASGTLIFLGALFTGLGLFDKLAKIAGAGTIVPITGFSNAIVSAALEFKSEGFILGMAAKMFTVAGPVLVFGISGSVLYGLLYVLLGGAA
ncbi:MAG: stage V sporulation protein AC [Ruminococcaceae bacterium]|nr:stage V sporulation protein AC [Oscillospiraceae bacterium]